MRRQASWGAAAALAVAGVGFAAPADPLSPTAAAFVAGDCARCHDVHVAGVPAASRLDSCRDCHVWIRDVSADPAKRAKAAAVFPLWPRYEKNIASYLQTPDLDAAMARLEPTWVASYLRDPLDTRPHLAESMPRFSLSDEQIALITAEFGRHRKSVPVTPPPDAGRVAEGGAIFAQRGCAGCHAFGALSAGGLPQSPDLAHARDRMSPDVAVAWILAPQSFAPGATMPALGLTEAEAVAVRDYLWLADPSWKPAAALGPPPVATTAPVSWTQVEERVTGRICQHCHMKPELNQGRAGPGNAGGFGFAATGIELQTYEGVCAAKDRIPDALMRRRVEAHRDVVSPGEQPAQVARPERPGMPMGLPPLSDEDISLVLGWIAQGCPR